MNIVELTIKSLLPVGPNIVPKKQITQAEADAIKQKVIAELSKVNIKTNP